MKETNLEMAILGAKYSIELVLKEFLEAGNHGWRKLLEGGGTQAELVKCGGSGSQPPR